MLKLDGAHVRNTSLPKTQRVQRQTPGPPLLLRSCSKGNTICFPNQKLRCSPHCGEAGCRRAGAHGAPSAPFPGTALPRLPPLADERLTLLLHPSEMSSRSWSSRQFSAGGGGPRQLPVGGTLDAGGTALFARSCSVYHHRRGYLCASAIAMHVCVRVHVLCKCCGTRVTCVRHPMSFLKFYVPCIGQRCRGAAAGTRAQLMASRKAVSGSGSPRRRRQTALRRPRGACGRRRTFESSISATVCAYGRSLHSTWLPWFRCLQAAMPMPWDSFSTATQGGIR